MDPPWRGAKLHGETPAARTIERRQRRWPLASHNGGCNVYATALARESASVSVAEPGRHRRPITGRAMYP